MSRADLIIQTLNDSILENISCSNRLWIRSHVKEMDIRVLCEDCVANVFDIADEWHSEGSILIQNGNPIHFKDDFHPGEEALLLTKHTEGKSTYYMIYLYSPKE